MAVSEVEYMEKQVESIVQTQKRPAWEFSIEINGAPKELDILARDLSYEPITINVVEHNIGSRQVSMPDGVDKTTLVVTVRDTADKKLYKWCKEWAAKIVHADGTFGMPDEYVKRVIIYSTTNKDDDKSPDAYDMMLTNVGAINPDRSNNKGLLEFPITLTEYKTSSKFQIYNL